MGTCGGHMMCSSSTVKMSKLLYQLLTTTKTKIKNKKNCHLRDSSVEGTDVLESED